MVQCKNSLKYLINNIKSIVEIVFQQIFVFFTGSMSINTLIVR